MKAKKIYFFFFIPIFAPNRAEGEGGSYALPKYQILVFGDFANYLIYKYVPLKKISVYAIQYFTYKLHKFRY